MARELILNGQIEDAVTSFKDKESAVPWDQQLISNWFRETPEKILKSIDLLQAKTTVDFKKAMKGYITRHPNLDQEKTLTKITELISMNVTRSKYVKKQTSNKSFNVVLAKLYKEVLEENHVHTT